MSQKPKKGDDWAPAYDPCKPYGCALQQCYVDMQRFISNTNTQINDKGRCLTERQQMEQCRSEHGLPGAKPLDKDAKPLLPPSNGCVVEIPKSSGEKK
jgi:hypothetical protein